MFERFTERARQVVVMAQDEAREMRHGYIGTMHLLLGLLREGEGLGGHILIKILHVELERAREWEVANEGLEPKSVADVAENANERQLPFTPRAKKVLEQAMREAITLGHNYIGTEHVLLALTHDWFGPAAKYLQSVNITPEQIRAAVATHFGEPVVVPSEAESVLLPNKYLPIAHDMYLMHREGSPSDSTITYEDKNVKLTLSKEGLKAEVKSDGVHYFTLGIAE